jgi:ATP-dependent RNA helicase DDX41
LLKGIEAVAIHGSKSKSDGLNVIATCRLTSHCVLIGPEEREFAITSFKDGRKDVLIASGVGSKGLDFAEIKVSLVSPIVNVSLGCTF